MRKERIKTQNSFFYDEKLEYKEILTDDILEIDDEEDDIEIDDEIDDEIIDEDIEDKAIESESPDDNLVLFKHKIEGKHSLKYDSIFKGKKETVLEESNIDENHFYVRDTIEVDKTSNYHQESINNEDYVRSKKVKEKVYEVLKQHTNINFHNNRRKPSRSDFNYYYNILKINLKSEGFTNVDIFNELSVYFSDNLLNMFKLLDNKWRNLIISELQEHIGKKEISKEISMRNIFEGTEIEFKQWDNIESEEKIITGVILEIFHDEKKYKVDSYENIYIISINNIIKILNNTKFKYNLNKLNNIDFL